MASADRATPVRQSRSVPNISKKSALTPYCELPGTPWPRDGPVGKIAELVTIPPAVTIVAYFRNDRLPKVVILIALPPVQKRFVGEPIAIPDALEPVLMAAYVVG